MLKVSPIMIHNEKNFSVNEWEGFKMQSKYEDALRELEAFKKKARVIVLFITSTNIENTIY